MNSFTLTQVDSVAAALADRASHDQSAYLSGGTNLVDLMKYNVTRPGHLTSLSHLPLHHIEALPDGGLRLGALVTNSATAYDAQVQARYPVLSQSILSGATPQLRNAATDGGNLNQRTRCPYFYDLATPCNKREPGTGCSALTGYNRGCGVLGTSESCIATHHSDMCVALAVLEAVVRVQGPSGERTIRFEDYHRLPGNTPEVDNTLQPGELVVAIDLPAQGYAEHFTYLKVRDRTSYAFATVSVAVGLEMAGDTITRARFALGGVAHKPWRDQEAEKMLEGQPASPELFRRVAAKVFAEAKGYPYNAFKIELGQRAIVRALRQAVAMDQARNPNAFLNSNP
ncbi:xanthine dehydrogenase family protein subunit M [Hymenobacter sp. GOD-10R]|uniref:FAD binding domain-containing protein n=1 Tax=Hymenobacter sp. GOD-10R TaxID=3093922 RepID=UPI002D79D8E1|nr:xanthine dehydrogenase family protein subunit M [Hymenobacter sp. GOD-10R]WRQ30654.1 xanthine dehydrogenase family protein subunit M [Hymenobacter sp. GOD-10R]